MPIITREEQALKGILESFIIPVHPSAKNLEYGFGLIGRVHKLIEYLYNFENSLIHDLRERQIAPLTAEISKVAKECEICKFRECVAMKEKPGFDYCCGCTPPLYIKTTAKTFMCGPCCMKLIPKARW